MNECEQNYANELIADGVEPKEAEEMAVKTALFCRCSAEDSVVTTYTVLVCGAEVSAHHDRAAAEAARKAARRAFIVALVHMGVEREDAATEAEIEVGVTIQ